MKIYIYFPRKILAFATVLLPLLASTTKSQQADDPWNGDFIGDLVDKAERAEIINGQVFAVNSTCLQIIDFYYDSTYCPQTYFWLSSDLIPSPNGQNLHTFEYGDNYIGNYRNSRVILNLPLDTTLKDFGSFGLWCQTKRSSLAYVIIPSTLSPPTPEDIPARLKTTYSGARYNLRAGPFQILDVRSIKVYGFSISEKSPDAYFVVGRGPVRNKHTISKVRVRGYGASGLQIEPLPKMNTKNSVDLIVDLPENQDVYSIDWLGVYSESYFSDFGHVTVGNLTNHIPPHLSTPYNHLESEKKLFSVPWPKTTIFANDTAKDLQFQLGPPGGSKGYFAWFSQEPNKYVWYVNDLMSPEIVLESGVTYHFRVQGGNDEKFQSFYHPLYISDDAKGGYIKHTLEEKQKIYIYAGQGQQNVEPGESYVGRACIHIEKEGSDPETHHSFSSYAKNLHLRCAEGEPGQFSWTPSADLVGKNLYYQSYSTPGMGGRITVTEKDIPMRSTAHDGSKSANQRVDRMTSSTKNPGSNACSTFASNFLIFSWLVIFALLAKPIFRY